MDGTITAHVRSKRGVVVAKRKAKAAGQRAGKTRVELRLDDAVYEKVKHLADGAQITVNQLVNALVRAGQ